MSRAFGYGVCQSLLGTGGSWPFGNYDLHCRTAEARLRAVVSWGELLYVPPIYYNDPLTRDPVAWLKRVMAQYVNNGDES